MPEAIMICCDCSEWMRNGDAMPTRFESQKDAVSLISNTKTDQNQENTIGLISMGGNGKADVLVNCTSDVGKVLSAANKMKIDGKADILIALQTSQLALKHRKNKKQDQRIVLFVGSPVECSEKLLSKAGKRLKKNNVAVDVVSFGEVEQNASILESFLSAVNSNNNSHLVSVPPTGLISDAIFSSPIFNQQAAMNEFAGLGDGNVEGVEPNVGGGNGIGEVDPNLDPELAMAIRMSLEAERQRREAEAKQATDASIQSAAQQQPQHPPLQQPQQQPPAQLLQPMDVGDDADAGGDDDEDLIQALRMSVMDESDDKDAANDVVMQDNNNKKKNSNDIDNMLNNEAFMDELLSHLPGIDKDDINIHEILNDDAKNTDENEKKDDKDKDKNKDKEKKDDKEKQDKQ